MIALILIALGSPDDSIRSIEIEDAKSKAKVEKSLDVIEREIKRSTYRCPAEKTCPACNDNECPIPVAAACEPCTVTEKPKAPWWPFAVSVSMAVGFIVGAVYR